MKRAWAVSLTSLTLMILTWAVHSFAVVNGEVIHPVLHPADEKFLLEKTVQIYVLTSDHALTCTGVVSDAGEIIAAGHCFGKKGSYYLDRENAAITIIQYDPKSPTLYRQYEADSAEIFYSRVADLAVIQHSNDLGPKTSTPIVTTQCDDETRVVVGFGVSEVAKPEDNMSKILWSDAVQGEKLRLSRGVELVGEKAEGLIDLEDRSTKSFGIIRQTTSSRTCFGDSGGPVFCKSDGRWALAGIVSSVSGGTGKNLDPVADNCSYRPFVVSTKFPNAAPYLNRLRDKMPEGPMATLPQ